jgi:hypothetical protein
MVEVAAVRSTPAGSIKGGGLWWHAGKAGTGRRGRAQGIEATAMRLS